ncbi:MAG: GatB/YqeY domain-containing protein [Candidatus Paceibacterota bacterium]
MSYIETIREDLKNAMRNKEAEKLTTLRGLIAGFTNELVASGQTPQSEVTDEIVLTVLKKQAKQRKDAIEQFTAGGRDDLVANEKAELAVIGAYLPATMSHDEIRVIAESKKAELGVTDKAGMGKLMGAIISELKDKADGGDVKSVVESLF